MIQTIALTDQTTIKDLTKESEILCDNCGQKIQPYLSLAVYGAVSFKKLLCLKCMGKELK
jgi:hypothetical protein